METLEAKQPWVYEGIPGDETPLRVVNTSSRNRRLRVSADEASAKPRKGCKVIVPDDFRFEDMDFLIHGDY